MIIPVRAIHERTNFGSAQPEGLLEIEIKNVFDIDASSMSHLKQLDETFDRLGKHIIDIDVDSLPRLTTQDFEASVRASVSAASGAFALSRDSRYSASGLESATMPPPT